MTISLKCTEMLRTIIGDHAYLTHRTHQQALYFHGIPEPADLMCRLAMSLQARLHRRTYMLSPNDILHTVNWSHLADTIHILTVFRREQLQVSIAVEPGLPICTQAHTCSVCQFSTTSLANLRRHQTTCHATMQLRTFSTHYLSIAHRGKPQCNHGFRHFATWHSFIAHVERDCCQVSRRMDDTGRTSSASMPDQVLHLPQGFSVDHFHISHQPFWPTLKHLVQQGRWEDIALETEVGDHLKHHCMICGTWMNRFQEMHGHYKLHHADLVLGGVAKGVQLSILAQTTSPCAFCSTQYQRVHSCTVTLQIGILHILMASDSLQVAKCCEVCQTQFLTLGELYRHICSAHDQAINDWCPARDSLQDSDACSHCGATFDSRSGLRRHITEGRCVEFGPLATALPCNMEQKWGLTMRLGKVYKPLISASQRLQLTINCQLCGMHYDRAGDLVAHLLQTHGRDWQLSQPLLRHLLQHVQTSHGCQCNPAPQETSNVHVCVGLRQIAMIFQHCACDLLVLTQFADMDLARRFAHFDNEPVLPQITRVLTAREFHQLWTSMDILNLLRTRCVLCGGYYRPEHMMRHLQMTHHQGCEWAAQHMFQIIPLLQQLQSNDFQCVHCTMVFNLPLEHVTSPETNQRLLTQTAHFESNCPIALQIALILWPEHGWDVGHQRQGTDGQPPGPRASTLGGTEIQRRKRRPAPHQETQARSTRRTRRQDPAARPDNTAQGHGSTGPLARTEHPVDAQAGLLRYVRTIRSSRSQSLVGQSSQNLEGPTSATDKPSTVDDANVSDGRSPEGITPSGETGEWQPTRPTFVGDSSQEGHHHGGRRVALHEMGARPSQAGPGCQNPVVDATDDQGIRDPGSPAHRQHAHHAIPQSQESGHCDPVDSSGLNEGRGILDLDERPDAQRGLGSDGHECQAAQPDDVEKCTDLGLSDRALYDAPPQGTRQRQVQTQGEQTMNGQTDHFDLRGRMLNLALDNAGTMCYANSAILCFLWSCLSRKSFQRADWGTLSAEFHQLLISAGTGLIKLDEQLQQWFHELIASWTDPNEQADSAEFTHFLLTKVGTTVVSNAWARIVMMGEKLITHDFGHVFQPITLQLDPAMLTHEDVSLDNLIRLWSNELGMTSGLTTPKDLLVFHLDRFVQTPQGQLRKLRTAVRFCWAVHVPIMQTSGQCTWEPYQVIAAFAHLGDSRRGHYQAILRTFPDMHDLAAPTTWLFCDDRQIPTRCWTFPPMFEEGVTCFWLCKATALDLYQLPTHPEPEPLQSDMPTDLLAYLQQQPNI